MKSWHRNSKGAVLFGEAWLQLSLSLLYPTGRRVTHDAGQHTIVNIKAV